MLPLVKRLTLLALFLAACSRPEQQTAPSPPPVAATTATAQPARSFEQEVAAWQANRVTRLKGEDNWLSLVGLFWLNPGANTFGSDKSNDIDMPSNAPAKCGVLSLKDGKVTLVPAPAAAMSIDGKAVTGPVELRDDTSDPGPTVVGLGSMKFQIIKRGDRLGIRVKDPESAARKNFKGLEYYPPDPKWRVEARLVPHNPPKKIPITNVLNMTADEVSPGALVFTVDGKEYRLDPIIEQGETDYFIIFKDATSKDTTYGAGRYLYASPAGADGKVIVDFNKAYNPPCAFTPFATCPLPPAQNRLAIRVEAGEKKYGQH
jgi:uncharacterized protein (DUF1684 family)